MYFETFYRFDYFINRINHMRYIPNLIPENSKVLKDYFKVSKPSNRKSNLSLIDFLRWLGGILLLIFALAHLRHPFVTLLFGFMGFIILPPGHNWIEKKLRFSFTTKIKSILGFVLFLISIPLLGHYKALDKAEAHLLKVKIEREEKQKAEKLRRDKIRNDSLVFYIAASSQLANKHKTDEAVKQLKKAFVFAELPEDKSKIALEKKNISTVKAFDLIKSKNYKLALMVLDTLILNDKTNSNLLYNRAICYSKTGKIREAVYDCKIATQLGDKNAERLYNKINPIKKRIIGYITRCCDGSTSGSTGRGTCSHHGGVCDWQEPVYEEYRKYE